LISIN